MLNTKRVTKLAAVAVLMGLGSTPVAWAQASVEVALPELSSQEKLTRGEEYLATMSDITQQATAALEAARSANDIERIAKVREALTAMRGLLKLSEQNLASLRAALGRGDKRGVDAEFVKLTIAYNKFLELDAQVRTAGGPGTEKANADGRPVIERQVDSDVPQLSPSSGVQNFGVLLDRPPSASGTL